MMVSKLNRIFVSYGLGGVVFDPPNGERLLISRLKAIGASTQRSPYQWSDVQTIVDAILAAPKDAIICVGGDSLGANEAPAIAQALRGKRTIHYLFGFQRSQYGVQVDVPDNVLVADSIFDPNWFDTFGLGDDPWRLAAGNKRTNLRNIAIRAMHPDDYGEAQDLVFDRIKSLIGE